MQSSRRERDGAGGKTERNWHEGTDILCGNASAVGTKAPSQQARSELSTPFSNLSSMIKQDINARYTAKFRVLAATRDDHDWRAVATAHESNVRTAANWVSAARATDEWEPPQGE